MNKYDVTEIGFNVLLIISGIVTGNYWLTAIAVLYALIVIGWLIRDAMRMRTDFPFDYWLSEARTKIGIDPEDYEQAFKKLTSETCREPFGKLIFFGREDVRDTLIYVRDKADRLKPINLAALGFNLAVSSEMEEINVALGLRSLSSFIPAKP